MTRRRPTFSRAGVAALAILLIAKLLSGPWTLPPTPAGLIPICAGAEIIYVDPATGQPVETPDGSHSTPCPYFGLAQGVEPPAPLRVPRTTGFQRVDWRVADRASAPSVRHLGFRSRAPPTAA